MSLNSEVCVNKGIGNRVKYFSITKDFYTKLRNEINQTKLDFLAKRVEESDSNLINIGKFKDEQHYLKTLELLSSATHETKQCGLFLLKRILPLLNEKSNFLDVGPGNGVLTKWISSKFKQTTVIDINSQILKALKLPSKIKLNKIQGSILNIDLPYEHYNFCILFHVLYYIEQDQWLDVIKRVYDSIKPGGIIVVVLSGDGLGKGRLIKSFGGKYIEIDSFVSKCSEILDNDVNVFLSESVFRSSSLMPMLHISNFLLYDANITAAKNKVIEYLIRNHKKQDGSFEITSLQKFVLISK